MTAENYNFSYSINKSLRARKLRITIKGDASVVVTLPHRMDVKHAEKFIKEKSKWIENSLEKIKVKISKQKISKIPKGNKRDFKEKKELALNLVNKKLTELNKVYNFKWNNVSIKNTKTRWGSCSRRGNLNFNYRIIFLEENLIDYLVVHELCHLKEMNHSEKFWKLVENKIPNYKTLRKELKNI